MYGSLVSLGGHRTWLAGHEILAQVVLYFGNDTLRLRIVDDHLTTTRTLLRFFSNAANVVYVDNWFGMA